jgi:hypothetical protein
MATDEVIQIANAYIDSADPELVLIEGIIGRAFDGPASAPNKDRPRRPAGVIG